MSFRTGIITNIQRCSTEDGPGIRTTVFMKGCPMRCTWCHNIETINAKPELVWYSNKCIGNQACVRTCDQKALQLIKDGMVIDRNRCTLCGDCEDACPSGAISIMGKEWEVQKLIEELSHDKVFFDTSKGGVTISGGEPTYQNEFVIELAEGLRKIGIQVILDTCGYTSDLNFKKILDSVDMVLFDLKQMDPGKHEEFTGVPLASVISNAKILGKSELPTWIRTPIIPGYTDTEENIIEISKFVLENMPNVERYDLLAFNKMCVDKYTLFGLKYPLKDADLVSKEKMEHLVNVAREVGVENVHWSGMTKLVDKENTDGADS
jgi:pyruvate formate lyase activating enzyme